MQKNVTLILLLAFLPGGLFSQKALIDSLERLLLNERMPKLRIDLLCGLSRLYTFSGALEQAQQRSEEALQLSRKSAYPKGEVIATLLQSGICSHQGEFDREAALIQQACAQARSLGQPDLEVFAQYQLAEYYSSTRGDYDAAERLLQEALKRVDVSVTQKNLGNLYKTLGLVCEQQGKMEASIAAYQRALGYFEACQNKPDIDPDLGRPSALSADRCQINVSETHSYLIFLYQKKADHTQALFHANKALEIAERFDAHTLLPYVYHDLGVCEQALGQYSQAIGHFAQGLEIARQQKLPRDEVVLLYQLGHVHQDVGERRMAKDYFTRGLHICRSISDSLLLLRGLDHLSWVCLQLKELPEATAYLSQAMKICVALSDNTQLARLTMRLAETRQMEGKLIEALRLGHDGMALLQRLQHEEALVAALSQIARIHLQAASFDSALVYAKRSFEVVEAKNLRPRIRNCHKLLSEIWEKKGDLSQALYHQKVYAAWGDSLRNDEAMTLLKAQQVKQKVDDYRAEADKALQNAALLRTQNRLYLGIAAGLLAALLSIGYFFWKLRRAKVKIHAQNLQLTELNQTKDKFFGIIAHDLRNPLSAFQGVGEQLDFYLKKGDTAKLQRISALLAKSAANLSGLLDNLLSWALLNRGTIPYNPESLSLVTESAANLEIHENAAAAKRIHLENQIPGHLRVLADRNALQAILRNLIGNAIKFTPAGGVVRLGCEERGGQVFITVQDTGTGISAEKLDSIFSLDKHSEHGTAGEKGVGLGLLLCKELAELNRGAIRAFSALGKGSTFELSLPSV